MNKDTCDCINKLYEHYDKEIPGGINFNNTVTMVDMSTGKTINRPPLLRFNYYALGKSGKPTKRIRSNYITPNYCQFCGKKY